MRFSCVLVLYSLGKNCWKIVDFGTSSHATSTKAHTTRLGRGTASYRAPEIISEDARYTNKVDIWALGCILFELATGGKAFSADWNVHEYAVTNSVIDISIPLLPPVLESHLSANIQALLEKVPRQRPRASTIRLMLTMYCRYFNFLFDQHEFTAQPQLSYSTWRAMAERHSDERSFQDRVEEIISSMKAGSGATDSKNDKYGISIESSVSASSDLSKTKPISRLTEDDIGAYRNGVLPATKMHGNAQIGLERDYLGEPPSLKYSKSFDSFFAPLPLVFPDLPPRQAPSQPRKGNLGNNIEKSSLVISHPRHHFRVRSHPFESSGQRLCLRAGNENFDGGSLHTALQNHQ